MQVSVLGGVACCVQLTVMVGTGGGLTLIVVVPDPETFTPVPPVAVTLAVALAGYGPGQTCVAIVVVNVAPLPQSHKKLVAGGAPFCRSTFAVNVTLTPVVLTTTDEGLAVNVTMYAGAGAGVMVIVVVADPETFPPVAVTFAVAKPIDEYAGQATVVGAAVVNVAPLPQSHVKLVAGGAPFCRSTVAVNVTPVVALTTTDEGLAVNVTVYAGTGVGGCGGGAGGSLIVILPLADPALLVTVTVYVPAVANVCEVLNAAVCTLDPSPNVHVNGPAVDAALMNIETATPVVPVPGRFKKIVPGCGVGAGAGFGGGAGVGAGGAGVAGCVPTAVCAERVPTFAVTVAPVDETSVV
jgi:hypothetical protein